MISPHHAGLSGRVLSLLREPQVIIYKIPPIFDLAKTIDLSDAPPLAASVRTAFIPTSFSSPSLASSQPGNNIFNDNSNHPNPLTGQKSPIKIPDHLKYKRVIDPPKTLTPKSLTPLKRRNAYFDMCRPSKHKKVSDDNTKVNTPRNINCQLLDIKCKAIGRIYVPDLSLLEGKLSGKDCWLPMEWVITFLKLLGAEKKELDKDNEELTEIMKEVTEMMKDSEKLTQLVKENDDLSELVKEAERHTELAKENEMYSALDYENEKLVKALSSIRESCRDLNHKRRITVLKDLGASIQENTNNNDVWDRNAWKTMEGISCWLPNKPTIDHLKSVEERNKELKYMNQKIEKAVVSFQQLCG